MKQIGSLLPDAPRQVAPRAPSPPPRPTITPAAALAAIEARQNPPADATEAQLVEWERVRSIRRKLDDAVRVLTQPHPDVRPTLPTLQPHVEVEARAELERLDAMFVPVDLDTLRDWLLPVNAVVHYPLTPNGFDAVMPDMLDALRDLPAAAFNVRTRRDAMNEGWDRFPTPKQIRDLLAPRVVPWSARRTALRDLLNPRQRQAVEAITPEQRAQTAARARARVAELMARSRESDAGLRAAPRRPLGRGLVNQRIDAIKDLLATWKVAEAQNAPGAAERVASLQRQLDEADAELRLRNAGG